MARNIFPDSHSTAELGEVGWTDVSRAAAVAARQRRATFKPPPDSKAGSGGSGAGGSGSAAKAAKPKKTGETTNAAGERVLQYNNGGMVTVHKDGTATYRDANGQETVGTYTDPTPASTDPQGFKRPKPPQPAKPPKAAKPAAPTKAPPAARLPYAKLSRTTKGPVAGLV